MTNTNREEPSASSIDCAAIGLSDLSKDFYAMDLGDVWRVTFNSSPVGVKFAALNGVTFDVPKGEFVGVLGRNGAGKSTMLRTVGGVYSPTRGAAILSGEVLGLYEFGMGGNELMTGRQFAKRWLNLSPRTNVTIPAALEDIEEFCELGAYFDRAIRTYSTGMRARLYFGTITAANAQVVLIDEILAVGDEYFNAKCLRRLRRMLSNGAAGILASHDWSAVLRMCSYAVVLDHGAVVDQGRATDVVRRYLQLSPPNGSGARFGELPKEFYARTGHPATFKIPIEIDSEFEFVFGLSIEQFREGIGWEHLVLRDSEVIGRGAGKFLVTVVVPDIPLKSGEYIIGLFLGLHREGRLESVDERSWTNGNPLKLIVRGSDDHPGTQLKMHWSARSLP